MPSMYRKLRFDPTNDLTPVVLIANTASLLVVHPSLAAQSVKDLIALAKAQPGQIPVASSGAGTTTHLKLEMFKALARVDLLHVPYKGGGPAISDLLGGQVKAFFNPPGAVLPHVKAGRLRVLGVTSAKRVDFAPDIPTIAESGVPGYEAYIWYAMYGPKSLPAALTQRWNETVNRYLKTPQAQQQLSRSFMSAQGGSAESFAAYHKSETTRWAEVVKSAGMKPQ